ncbi:hypothetical protein [Chitinimonas lacunae]|uniref:Lipoprotein n=1 Tax=Chitinimonas lacunae TaxID=1963018 RepID=A0ABV8MKJ4_9NEIS
MKSSLSLLLAMAPLLLNGCAAPGRPVPPMLHSAEMPYIEPTIGRQARVVFAPETKYRSIIHTYQDAETCTGPSLIKHPHEFSVEKAVPANNKFVFTLKQEGEFRQYCRKTLEFVPEANQRYLVESQIQARERQCAVEVFKVIQGEPERLERVKTEEREEHLNKFNAIGKRPSCKPA